MKKTGIRICVLLLAVVMLLSVLMPAMSTLAGAVTASDIQDIKDNLSDVKSQKESLETQLEEIRNDKEATEEKVGLLQEQILLTEQQIYESQKLLDNYDQQIADKKAEISKLEEQEASQYEEFYTQTRWMEENGGTSVISVLFQASSFSELLDTLMLVTDIMNYNDRIITQLEQTQADLAQARDELQTARDDQAATQAQMESAKADLTSQKSEADKYYQQLVADEKDYDSKVADLAADLEDIQADLKDAEEKYQQQLEEAQKPSPPPSNGGGNGGGSTGGGGSVVDPTGTWYWPLPGYYYISSVYGGRYNPISGVWETHRGADVPAPGGTPIQAASSGVVTTAKHGPSYGNYCVIYHGNGYATLYAHMQSLPNVSVGDVVSAGQVIGYVGSTGDSTGNHLHFELTINGSLANALDLYPNLSFSGI
ncbi:M23 family metallopeptidase [Pseudoflavonifractor sp. An85]|uniref:murein hydrolase activator EnvC family protein n=1 Tax=Pseudoflavonifractor sp. An85 TaxID=1965661 RepID=UPI000B3A2488|nr:M23 family metallopeptidase [Pseudoflavonifractor sp. An85]OUN26010.1 hypothetical protein B5G37_01910 [Pseudoflavonifractor sp. An85]